jgi:excisionase family DNA binding protein
VTCPTESESQGQSELLIEIRLPERDIEHIAARVAAHISEAGGRSQTSWLDVEGAAAHVGMSANAIRGLVKRRQIPFHRTPNRRLRFFAAELDQWIRAGSCETTHGDLP